MLVYFKKKCQVNLIKKQNVLWRPIKLQELQAENSGRSMKSE